MVILRFLCIRFPSFPSSGDFAPGMQTASLVSFANKEKGEILRQSEQRIGSQRSSWLSIPIVDRLITLIALPRHTSREDEDPFFGSCPPHHGTIAAVDA